MIGIVREETMVSTLKKEHLFYISIIVALVLIGYSLYIWYKQKSSSDTATKTMQFLAPTAVGVIALAYILYATYMT